MRSSQNQKQELKQPLVSPSVKPGSPGGGRHSGVYSGKSQPQAPTHEMDDFERQYGYTWDYCVVFPAPTRDPPPKTSLKEQVVKFHSCGLETYLYYSLQQDEVYCKIRAPVETLAKFADDMGYTMLLDETRLKVAMEAGSEDHPKWAGRHITHDPTITKYRPHEYIYGKYKTSEKLASMYSLAEGLSHPFSNADRLKLIKAIITANTVNACGINLVQQVEEESMLAYFPLHMEDARDHLLSRVLKKWQWPGRIPLDDIRMYFGEKIGLYFAFLSHYTVWLVPLSVVGVIVVIDTIVEETCSATLVPYMCIFVAFWAVLLLEYWKRTEATLSMKWGHSNYEAEEHDRPEYVGEPMISFIDGEEITYFPPEKRSRVRQMGGIVISSMLVIVIGAVAAIFVLKWWATYETDDSFFNDYGTYLGSILNSTQIIVLNIIYKNIAVYLTNQENHRTDTEYEDALIAKLFLFQFVNSYASLFYISFIMPYLDGACGDYTCMFELCETLGFIFCIRLASANISEIYVPRILAKRKEAAEREGVKEGEMFSKAELEYAMGTYDEMMGPLEDMSELSIQFGYVTLFVTGFPLAPLLALCSNYLEIRIDIWKISHENRRPQPKGAQDIGTWQMIYTIMAVISVATNAGLVFFTAENFTDWEFTWRVWGFIIFQYVVYSIQFLFSYFVDDVPENVTIQLERAAFITSKIIEGVADEEPSNIVITSPRKAMVSIAAKDDHEPPPQDRVNFGFDKLT